MSRINLVNSDGTQVWSPSGDVYLNDNPPVTYTVDGVEKKVTVNCSVPNGFRQYWYGQLMNCISNHAESVLYNAGSLVSVNFRRMESVAVTQNGSTVYTNVPADTPQNPDGYYVAKVNGIEPLMGNFDIVGGPTFRWAPASSGLTVADIARPDVDCIDYMQLSGYIARIEDVLNDMAKNVNGVPDPRNTDPLKVYGVWKQYQALRELWNYLVIRNMVVFNAQYQGDKAYFKARLSNTSEFPIPVGKMTLGFQNANYDGLYEAASSFDNNGVYTEWSTSSAKRQPMSSGSWQITPNTSCMVAPGGYIELSIRFSIYNTTSAALNVGLTKRDTPWVGQWPETSGSLVTKPGNLSWTHTHFNPTSYNGNPPGLPPNGDGCLYRFSPGTATAEWLNNGPAVSPTKPSVYIGLTCTHSLDSTTFNADFDQVVETDEPDPDGQFSIDLGTNVATLKWTPTGGSAVDVLKITMTNRHFHDGDGITLSLPRGWCEPLSASSIKVLCVWDIPSNQLVTNNSTAGGSKNLLIPAEAASTKVLKKRVTLDSQLYEVDSVRTPYVYVSVSETDDDPPFDQLT